MESDSFGGVSDDRTQALTMRFIDLFWMLIVGIACTAPLVFLLRPLPARQGQNIAPAVASLWA